MPTSFDPARSITPCLSKSAAALLGGAALFLAGCSTTDDAPMAMGSTAGDVIGTAVLQNAAGQPVGTARISGTGDNVGIAISFAGLPPGLKAVHLHTTGECRPPDFTSANGHLNPEGYDHGIDDGDPPHLGDLENVLITDNGTGTLRDEIRGRAQNVAAHLFDRDGTAIVVHSDPDDYVTDPSGGAGSRIACGVVQRG